MSEQAPQAAAAAGASEEISEFEKLLERDFKPKGEGAREDIKNAVRTLAETALASTNLVSDDAIKSIQAMIAAIDAKLTEQVNEIIHNEAFRTLEGTWRGLHYLINNTETDETLKIRVMNISKKDVGKVLKKFKGVAWDQSPLFKQVYEAEYGTIGGEPFGCLVGDYQFDHSPPDVEILQGMAQMCMVCHQRDDIHQNSLGPRCSDCHTQQTFTAARFNHDRVGCTLTGIHRVLPCVDCHKGGNYAGLSAACIACHRDDAVRVAALQAGGIRHDAITSCGSCHNTTSFRPPRAGGTDSVCR